MSHLGKYVPGKAMVVVFGSGMIVSSGGRASTAAIATFYETLVMMAAGGLIAALGFALAVGSNRGQFEYGSGTRSSSPSIKLPPQRAWCWDLRSFWSSTAGVQLAGGIRQPAHPRRRDRGAASRHGPLLGQGLLWSFGGWFLLGISQLAVVRAFDKAGAESVVAPAWCPW